MSSIPTLFELGITAPGGASCGEGDSAVSRFFLLALEIEPVLPRNGVFAC